jgi:hypothetical protein
MEKSDRGLHNWIPLITKLVWPFFIVILLLIFNKQASEIYNILLSGIKSGRSIEIGFIKLGEAAKNTKIANLSQNDISIKGVGGLSGAVSKRGASELKKLKKELKRNPSKTINTLLLTDNVRYTSDLLKEYIGTLGIRFIVFQKRGKFDGWIASSTFVAQLPEDEVDIRYEILQNHMIGIQRQTVRPTDSARKVLKYIESTNIDSIPVVDKNKKWLFFANRGDILARLMTNIILEKENE